MPTNVIMPQMGESVAEGTITKWLKKLGERVERDEPLFEISTDKVDAEIPSPAAGRLAQILVKENETVAVNTVVAVIDGEGAALAAPVSEMPSLKSEIPTPPPAPAPALSGETAAGPSAPPAQAPFSEPATGAPVKSSPLVRRIARENQVDLARIKGTGLGGRVSKKDILTYLEERQKPRGGRHSRLLQCRSKCRRWCSAAPLRSSP